MKLTVVKLKTAILIALAAGSLTGFAQAETMMYVMKNGEVVFQSPVSGVDNVTFDEAASNDALIVHKNDDSPADKIRLNTIQQLSFGDENLSVETSTGSETYMFEDIMKLLFGDMTTGINNRPAQGGLDVFVYLTPAGDVIVECSIAIRSLALFSVDGRMISLQPCANEETLRATSLQNAPAGVYLLRVETEQGTVVKKIVKPLNR